MRLDIRGLLLFFVAVSFATAQRASCQQLFALDYQSGQIEVFSVDPATGTVTPQYATGAPDAGTGETAFDPVGRRLFFESSTSTDRLYTVNVDTGAISTAPLPDCCFSLEYDALSGTLWAIGYQNSQVEIFSLNPTTGAVTPRFSTGAPGLAFGERTFDTVGRRLFFHSINNELYIVNIDTGAVSTTPTPLSGCCAALEYDMVAAMMWGVGYQDGQVEIFTINPATWAVTPRFATGASFMGGTSTAFDPIDRRFFFQSNANSLYTVNVSTGAVSAAPIPRCCLYLRFAAAPPAAIPALSSAMLSLLAALLVLIATATLKLHSP